MSSFLNNGVRKTTLNKKKLGKILTPNLDGNNFSLIATGRENGVSLDDVFDIFGVFITEEFTDERGWESYSKENSTLFKNRETNAEAALLPIGHNHNGEEDLWDVRLNLEMKNLFTNYILKKQ